MAVNIIGRREAEKLIDEQTTSGIFQEIVRGSKVLSTMTRLPNMTSNQTRVRVLETLPEAFFVDGETGTKQTTKVSWDDKFINAEEIAVIVPIPEAILEDSSFDIVGQIRPLVVQAFHQKIDGAIFCGTDKPASWEEGLIDLARNYGHEVKYNPSASPAELWTKILDEGGVFNKVEADGFEVSKIVGSLGIKSKLRSLTDTTGRRIENSTTELEGAPISYVMNGTWNDSNTQMLAGDFSKAVYAMRQDLTMKVLTEAVIQDPATKQIVYNLAQQDMVALRFKLRMGCATVNPVTTMNGDKVTRFPFAILSSSAGTPLTTKKTTFTVKDAQSTPAVVEGATIQFAGMIKNTDSKGQAVFESVDGFAKDTPYLVVKGDIVKAGKLATKSATTVAVDNFA